MNTIKTTKGLTQATDISGNEIPEVMTATKGNEDGVAELVLPTTKGAQNAVYMIFETTTPNGADGQKAVPFIVGLPVYKEDESLLSPIKVYPKNEYRTSTLEFTKFGMDLTEDQTALKDPEKLSGAEFYLKDLTANKFYYKDENSFSLDSETGATKFTSDENGKVSVANLVLTDGHEYAFYEVNNTVSTSEKQGEENEADDQTKGYHHLSNPVVTIDAKRDSGSAKMILTYHFKDKNMSDQEVVATPTYDDKGAVSYKYTGANDIGAEVYNYKVPKPTKQADDHDLDIGQTVTFTITQNIPNDVAQYTTFELTDEYDASLELLSSMDAINSSVKIEDQVQSGVETTTTANNDKSFTVKFTDPKQLIPYIGKNITFTVNMKLRPDTALGDEGVNNDITFNNNFKPKHNHDTVKTYGHSFIKKDLDSGKTLQGAEFVIQNPARQYLINKDGEITWTVDKEAATKLVSDKDGAFSIAGLAKTDADGNPISYSLQEKIAPTGYVVAKTAVPFTADDGQSKLVVNNKSKGTLPSTGGKGIYAFIAVGVIALIIAGIYFTRGRKHLEA